MLVTTQAWFGTMRTRSPTAGPRRDQPAVLLRQLIDGDVVATENVAVAGEAEQIRGRDLSERLGFSADEIT